MREVTREEYEEFLKSHSSVVIEGKKAKLVKRHRIKTWEPENFTLEKTTVWSFENRGKWATHRGDYRGNWAPEAPRNLILRYTQPGDTVLDQMVGSGTTLVECKLLGRNGIGIDINLEALMVAWNRLDFTYDNGEAKQRLYLGDARHLHQMENDSVHLIATHPPYASIIRYSKQNRIEGDLSQTRSVAKFITGMQEVAAESFRMLKGGGHCGILVGDTHQHKHYVPIAYRVMETFLEAGFILREDVIKLQWHTETMRGRWSTRRELDFLLTFHEHLFIFRKPLSGERLSKYKNSMILSK